MNNAIEAKRLVKNYPGDVRALDGLSFSVAEAVFSCPIAVPPSRSVLAASTLADPLQAMSSAAPRHATARIIVERAL